MRTSKLKWVLSGMIAVLLMTAAGPRALPVLAWNMSQSAPTGLYLVLPFSSAETGQLVIARSTEPLSSFLAERGYLPRGVPLLKRICAGAGQTVCRSRNRVLVDGVELGWARAYDSRGQGLPVWEGCRVVGAQELFLMNTESPDSLDGRYFGTVPITWIVGKAVPVWVF